MFLIGHASKVAPRVPLGNRVYRALGVVSEEYVNEQLAKLADLSGANFVPPFKYAGGKESPDGFIRLG